MPDKGYISNSLFQGLPNEMKMDLLKRGARLDFFEKERLFRRGDKGRALYIVRKGEVTISLVSPDGKEIILNKLTDGEAFGEIALFDEGVRMADAFVEQGTVLVVIEHEAFLAFLEQHPAVYRDVLQMVCARLRWCSDLLEDFLFQDMMNRLVSRLVKLSEKSGVRKDAYLEITQDDLAKMMGASREAVNRNLQLLQDRGLVFLQRKRIMIPDVRELERLLEDKKGGAPALHAAG